MTSQGYFEKENEHESWFLELLYERPSGHMLKKIFGEHTSYTETF